MLRTRAACLNHRDLKLLQGSYGPRRPETRIPGSDGVGDVVAVGDGVPASWLGRRALFSHLVDWLDGAFTPAYFQADLGVSLDGWLAEQVVVRAYALVAVPDVLLRLRDDLARQPLPPNLWARVAGALPPAARPAPRQACLVVAQGHHRCAGSDRRAGAWARPRWVWQQFWRIDVATPAHARSVRWRRESLWHSGSTHRSQCR
mgnify:CR=1 FL=1